MSVNWRGSVRPDDNIQRGRPRLLETVGDGEAEAQNPELRVLTQQLPHPLPERDFGLP